MESLVFRFGNGASVNALTVRDSDLVMPNENVIGFRKRVSLHPLCYKEHYISISFYNGTRYSISQKNNDYFIFKDNIEYSGVTNDNGHNLFNKYVPLLILNHKRKIKEKDFLNFWHYRVGQIGNACLSKF